MSAMVFNGQFKEAMKSACAAIRKCEAAAGFQKVGAVLINSGFILNVEIKPCDRWAVYTLQVTTRGMINGAGALVDLETVTYECNAIADIMEFLKNCAAPESFDAAHAAYLEKARNESADAAASEFIDADKPGEQWRLTTVNRDGEKMFLTKEGRWSEYAFAAELFDHVPECSDPNSFYGTPMKAEEVKTHIALGDANHARIKVVTNAGMILIAPYFAVVIHDDGALFSHRWLMRHNLIENTEFCTYVKPDTIKTMEFIK